MSYVKIGVGGPVGSGKTALIERLTRKMSEKYSVGDDGKLANAAELVTTLKAENPNQFSKGKEIKEQKLPEGQPSGGLTKADFNKMSYKDKAELYQSDPETYKTLSSGGNNNNG